MTTAFRAVVASPGSWDEMPQAALAFAERDSLSALYVSFNPATSRATRLGSGVPGPAGRYLRREAGRRTLAPALHDARARASGWDLLAAGVNRASGRSRLYGEILQRRAHAFDRRVSRELHAGLDLVLAQAGSAGQTLERAKSLGLATALNWNIQHWQTALAEYHFERASNPRWAHTFTFGDYSPRMVALWQQELHYANRVLVPSSLVARSFTSVGVEAERMLVVPYGVDASRFSPGNWSPRRDGRLSIVCVGEVGQRKGLSYLFEAARQLPGCSFDVVGWRVRELPEPPPSNVVITENAPSVLPYLQRADLFVFPSLLDGFGLVVLQAMACGLPVICSDGAGAQDVIEEGQNGWVVPARDVTAIVQTIDRARHDPAALADMRGAARATALEYTWERFRQELAR